MSGSEGATLPGCRLDGVDDRGVRDSGLAFAVERESAFLLGDELLEGLEVLSAGFVTHVVIGDVDGLQGFAELAHIVASPGE
jgi:hypothetical protein